MCDFTGSCVLLQHNAVLLGHFFPRTHAGITYLRIKGRYDSYKMLIKRVGGRQNCVIPMPLCERFIDVRIKFILLYIEKQGGIPQTSQIP